MLHRRLLCIGLGRLGLVRFANWSLASGCRKGIFSRWTCLLVRYGLVRSGGKVLGLTSLCRPKILFFVCVQVEQVRLPELDQLSRPLAWIDIAGGV